MCGIMQFSAKLNKTIPILNKKSIEIIILNIFFLIGPPTKVIAYHRFKPIHISLNHV